ncbi:MAG: glycosyl hydrolase-related protein, partial [Chloroflexota bacterium]
HEVREKELYLTLLRSVLMLSSDGETGPAIPTPDAQEFKTYNFEYSIFPHRKDWKKANSFMPANEFNNNLIGFQLPPETRKRVRTLPSRLSFIELKPENLILVALKKAEDTNEVVLRCFETKGQRTEGVVNIFREPVSAKVVNLLEEEEEREIECQGGEIRFEVNPFEIVTLKLKF